jgi:type IX secretion system PorP/SprF family membrane protein
LKILYKIVVLISIVVKLSSNYLYAQLVPVYSQYLLNQSIINPGYIGIDNCLNINALYRQQWASYDGAPSTRTLSAHTPFRNRALATGINVVNDVIGVTSNTLLEGQFAYRLSLSDEAKLSFGIGAGLLINKNNFSSLKVNDAGDEVFINNKNATLPTFSFGVYFENSNFFGGFSTLNLTRHLYQEQTFVYQQPLYLTLGYNFQVNEKIKLSPSLLLKKVNNNPVNVDVNFLTEFYSRLKVGVSYRSKEAIYGILQFGINEQLQIGYSYDHSLTAIRKYQNGSHEVSIRYLFKFKTNTVDVKSFE